MGGISRIEEGWKQFGGRKHRSTQSEELLQFHIKFGHTGFAKLKAMAKKGIIPKHLADAKTPKCIACMHSTSTRKQWRNKRKED